MNPKSDAPLPGLATDEEMAAGRRVVSCRVCGRPLTAPDARMRGVGDGCADKFGGSVAVRHPGRFEVEQEGLFGG